jgi:hypothetical protein
VGKDPVAVVDGRQESTFANRNAARPMIFEKAADLTSRTEHLNDRKNTFNDAATTATW